MAQIRLNQHNAALSHFIFSVCVFKLSCLNQTLRLYSGTKTHSPKSLVLASSDAPQHQLLQQPAANHCRGSHTHQSSQLVLHRHAAMEAVVMETGERSAAADGTVTMEISAAAPAERADPEVSAQLQRGAAFPDRKHRILIVIGELSSRHHLDAVRNQIAQGKTLTGEAGITLSFGFQGYRADCLRRISVCF